MAIWYIYIVVIWYIFSRFGTLYREKSGNPATSYRLTDIVFSRTIRFLLAPFDDSETVFPANLGRSDVDPMPVAPPFITDLDPI
jgi:hypothetical protein